MRVNPTKKEIKDAVTALLRQRLLLIQNIGGCKDDIAKLELNYIHSLNAIDEA